MYPGLVVHVVGQRCCLEWELKALGVGTVAEEAQRQIRGGESGGKLSLQFFNVEPKHVALHAEFCGYCCGAVRTCEFTICNRDGVTATRVSQMSTHALGSHSRMPEASQHVSNGMCKRRFNALLMFRVRICAPQLRCRPNSTIFYFILTYTSQSCTDP